MPEGTITLTPRDYLDSLSYWQFLWFFNSCSFSCVFYCVLYPFYIFPSCSFPAIPRTSFHISFFLLLLFAPSSSESLLICFLSSLVILPLPIFHLVFLWYLAHSRFPGHCSSRLFFQNRKWICHSDKENKSWKSVPKLQDSIFSFKGILILKGKKVPPLLPPPAAPSLLSGLWASAEGQPDKKPLLGSDHLCSCSLPASDPFYCIFWKSRQKMVVLAFLIKKLEEREAAQESWRRGWRPNPLTVKTPFVEPERAQDGGRGRRTREVVVLGESFRLI